MPQRVGDEILHHLLQPVGIADDLIGAGDLRREPHVPRAGFAFVPAAERDPGAAYRANVGGTLALLAAVRAAAPGARLLAVMSSDIYGQVESADLPIDEDTPLRPLTVYGASQQQQGNMRSLVVNTSAGPLPVDKLPRI